VLIVKLHKGTFCPDHFGSGTLRSTLAFRPRLQPMLWLEADSSGRVAEKFG